MVTATELRKLIEENKAVLGTERVIKLLSESKLSKVFISSNCPKEVRERLKSFSGKAQLLDLEATNEELGAMCKKPFHVSVFGVVE